MIKILLVGRGGLRRYVDDILISNNVPYKIIGCVDDNQEFHGKKVGGIKVFGEFKKINELKNKFDYVVLCIGDKHLEIRKKYFKILKEKKIEILYLIHKKALISKGAKIGRGVIINSNSVINSSAKIGDNVVVSSGTIIEHDCIIGSHTFFGPGVNLGGGVVIGEKCLLGIGSIILPKVEIGENVTIGAGSVVTKNVPDNLWVIGNPGRVVRRE